VNLGDGGELMDVKVGGLDEQRKYLTSTERLDKTPNEFMSRVVDDVVMVASNFTENEVPINVTFPQKHEEAITRI
jgi:hypothetical protein